MKLFQYIILFILLNNAFYLSAQKNQSQKIWFLESYFHYGFAIPHHKYLAYFIKEHIHSAQINLGVITSGNKKWQQIYNLPSIGIGIHYSDLSNKEVFGNMFAFYGFFDRYFLNAPKKINFGNRISLGIGYVTKPFSLYSNPFNMAFSSHYNIYLNYSLESDFSLIPHLNLKAGIGLTHLSNGNTQKPNTGLNLISSFIGIRYIPGTSSFKNSVKSNNKRDSLYHKLIISGIYGLKSISRFNKNLYPVYAISLEYNIKNMSHSAFGLGITNYFDSSLSEEIKYNQPNHLNAIGDKVRIAINLLYEMRIGYFGILLQPGIYLRNMYTETGIMTNRAGIRYYINKNLNAQILIKAHWMAVADVLEYGIGYTIK